MTALVAHGEMFPYVRSMLTPDDFADDAARYLFILLEDCYRREELNLQKILQKIEDEGVKACFLNGSPLESSM
jgi:DNA primase